MNFWTSLLHNFPLVCAGTGWIVAQIIKVFTGVFKLRKFSITALLFGNGGMPSSHSASVTALAVSCGLCYGFYSGYFAIAPMFAIIVMGVIAFGCGTAAVVSPIGKLALGDKEYVIGGGKIGEVTQSLYDILTGIQWGKREDTFGWVYKIS